MNGTQRYVILYGQVFKWEQKAPFVPSGQSVQGAYEYDPETRTVKCHECGEWVRSVGHHMQWCGAGAGITIREYRFRHKLRQGIAIRAPKTLEEIRERSLEERLAARSRTQAHIAKVWEGRHANAAAGATTVRARPCMAEFRNSQGTCPEQWPVWILEEIKRLGRIPGQNEVPSQYLRAAIRECGNWHDALEEVGAGGFYRVALQDALVNFYVRNGRLPHRREFGAGRLPHSKIYMAVFGTLRSALRHAGLALVDSSARMSDQQHERALSAQEHQQEMMQADQLHQHALEQGQQSNQAAMDQQQAAASQQPQPGGEQ